MRFIYTILLCLIASACCKNNAEFVETSNPIVVYKEKANMTLADIAYGLLDFEKYEEALALVKDDTSMTAVTVKIMANDHLGNTHEAINHAILDLRRKDTSDFYEGSWELWELYCIFLKDLEYGLERLNEEYRRCNSNYQVRQLMMKLYWYLEDYEKVISLGDEFRKELPDMSSEVTFNYWRQDALDSLIVKDRPGYDKLMESYNRWNGVECIN